ncbi:hypothetical protein FA13DRAFT_1776319 [Coprinellus micaceus]|uniref:NACHT domain-containing protein n=1 Tax=Coprinellus micaceus TaxID=71717 RepID=A0A4Y7T0V8_COPMI|nr:hypothetical protein FA13DRAFT_1776319 [Coprinellus micaceus]
MDADWLPLSAPSIVGNNHVRNVAGDYHDNSTTNVKNIHISDSGRNEMGPLLEHVAHGALHDSAERGPDAPKCHPETRIAVQKDIISWIRHGEEEDTPKRILWLSGPAGSGKTAIAGTIADECYKQGLLAATFFFSAFAGSANRRWKRPLIPTLLYGLLQHGSIVGFKDEVLAVIQRDPMVFEKHLDQQLDALILKPLRNIAGLSNHQDWPSVIIVDGLDECQGDGESDARSGRDAQVSGSNAQKEILSALSRASADPAFPFRIIIASRPEQVIRHFFSTFPDFTLNIFLDDKYDPDADIRLFLEAMFSDIRRRYSLPWNWVSQEVVDRLVREASGQFIYAATVIRFLDNPRLGPPQQLLTQLLEWRSLDDSKPFAPLDALYSRILRTSPVPMLSVKWLSFIHDYNTNVEELRLYLKPLLESYPGQTEYVLGTLTSLVGFVDAEGEPYFRFYHKSLLDFLEDPRRSSDLHVSRESLNHFVMDLYHQILGRRPLANADPLTNPPSQVFLNKFCTFLGGYLDPYRRYTSADVEWWLANLHTLTKDFREIPLMFGDIHKKCKWYRCLPGCCVWRKGIVRYCREHGWRVPSAKETLRDRFKNFRFSAVSTQDYPLRRTP